MLMLLLFAAAPPTGPALDSAGVPLPDGAIRRMVGGWMLGSVHGGLGFGRDGALAATLDNEGRTTFWDTGTGRALGSLHGYHPLADALWLPGKRGFVFASRDGLVLRWDLAGRERWRVSVKGAPRLVIKDGKLSAIGEETLVLDRETGAVRERSKAVAEPERKPPGRLSHSGDEKLHLLHPVSGKRQVMFDVGSNICGYAFWPDGSRVTAWGHGFGGARTFETVTGMRTGAEPAGGLMSLSLSADGRLALAGGCGPTARLWDVETGKLIRSFTAGSKARTDLPSVALSPDGKLVAGAAVLGTRQAIVWDAATGKDLHRFKVANDSNMAQIGFCPGGKSLLHAGNQGNIERWDIATGKALPALGDKEENFWHLLADERRGSVVGVSLKTGFNEWDAATGKSKRRWKPAEGVAVDIVLMPDGKRFAAAGVDGWVAILDAETGKEERRWTVPLSRRLAVSPDGRHVAVAIQLDAVRLYETATGRELPPFVGHRRPVHDLAFTRSGRLLTASEDGELLVWDMPRLVRHPQRLRLSDARWEWHWKRLGSGIDWQVESAEAWLRAASDQTRERLSDPAKLPAIDPKAVARLKKALGG